jgi:uncharacterized protein (DUF1800 family)
MAFVLRFRPVRAVLIGAACLLAACGAEDPTGYDPASRGATPSATLGVTESASGAAAVTGATPPSAAPAPTPAVPPAPPAPTAPTAPTDLPADPTAAARFLSKATFGPTPTELSSLMSIGYRQWLEEQFRRSSMSHLTDISGRMASLPETATVVPTAWLQHSFWRAAVGGDDALRQRVAFALSQIFVVSMVDAAVGTRMAAAYLDLLGRHAFGNFRVLLEDVALSPAMGTYLSHLGNRKAAPEIGRLPDENFAREVMQLFTIGLYELNPDGTVRLDGRREPIETYTSEDVAGLARVFTGFSWGGPDRSPARFVNRVVADSDQVIMPMQGYPDYHESGSKRFLGITIDAATPEGSLRQALDHLFMHPNVGPFIGRQLIQRLVTSNPSPAYVGRVSAAFADDGRGVRGDMKAVLRAVLLDPEAFGAPAERSAFDGRLREPVLRMATLLRALAAKSASGGWTIGQTDDPSSLGQSAMRSPSVFNFYRPSYVPPNTALADGGLVAPELAITHETSVVGWVNTVRALLDGGLGSGRDVRAGFEALDAIAHDPAALVDRLILLMAPGQVPASLRARLIAEVESVALPRADAPGATTESIEAARRNRSRLATLLLAASPEFLVQR